MKKNNIVLLSAVALLTASILTTFYYRFSKNKLLDRTAQQLQQEVGFQRSKLSTYLERTLKALQEQGNSLTEHLSAETLMQVPITNLPKNGFLVSGDRIVLASVHEKIPTGTNFALDPYRHTNAGSLIDRIHSVLMPDLSFYDYYPTLNQKTLFIGTPLINAQQLFTGFLVQEMDMATLFALVTKNGLHYTWFISQVLNQKPFIVVTNSTSNTLLDQFKETVNRANAGSTEQDIIESSDQIPYMSAWTYEPFSTWGIAAHKATAKVLKELNSLFVVLILLWLLAIGTFIWLGIKAGKRLQQLHSPQRITHRAIKTLLTFLTIALVSASIFLATNIYTLIKNSRNKIITQNSIKLENLTSKLEEDFFELQFSITTFADEIKHGALKEQQQIEERAKQILEENKDLLGITIAYNPAIKLHAPTWIKNEKEIVLHDLVTVVDYPSTSPKGESAANWYNQALQKKSILSNAYVEPFSKKRVITYAIPFMMMLVNGSQIPGGVIAIHYPLENFEELINVLMGDSNGLTIIFDQDHAVIFSIGEKKYSHIAHNESVIQLIERAKKVDSGFSYLVDHETNKTVYAWFNAIHTTKWVAIHTLYENQIQLPGIALRHLLFLLITAIIASLVVMLLFASFAYHLLQDRYYTLGIIVSTLFIMGIVLIIILSKKEMFQQQSTINIINTKAKLTKYLDIEKQKALENHLPIPIPVTIGADISSITLSSNKLINFASHIWQKFPKDNNPGIRFPQALKNLQLRQMYSKTEGNETITGWDLFADLHQELSYYQYPFDKVTLEIFIQPKVTNPSFIFIPDLTKEHLIEPDTTIADFRVTKSFFAYTWQPYQDELLTKKDSQLAPTGLSINVNLDREFINPLINDIIPLLIVFLTLFLIKLFGDAQLDATKKEKDHILSAIQLKFTLATSYTALFFTLIVMHSRIRSVVIYDRIIFIEYFYFCAYISLLLLLLSNLSTSTRFMWFSRQCITYLFWPIQTAVWFIFTLITFYNP